MSWSGVLHRFRYRLVVVVLALVASSTRGQPLAPVGPTAPLPGPLAPTSPPPPPSASSPVIGSAVPDSVRSDDPFRLDGMMSPQPVPPRTSYQRPLAGPTAPDFRAPDGMAIPLPPPASRPPQFIPRYGGSRINYTKETLREGPQRDIITTRIVVTGGIIVFIGSDLTGTKPTSAGTSPETQFAADEAVIWIRDSKDAPPTNGLEVREGARTEIYLAGNVIVRTQGKSNFGGQNQIVQQTLRADQVYYDVEKNKAIALSADLELSGTNLPDSIHLGGKEIQRLSREQWEFYDSRIYSSKLPSDPGVEFDSPHMTLIERETKRNIFGIPYYDLKTGQYVGGTEQLLTSRNVVTRIQSVPLFYLPYFRTDASDPLGPLLGVNFGEDRIFGTQFYTSWDLFKLLALKAPQGYNWRLHLDYLTSRGPAAGTDFSYQLNNADPTQPPTGRGLIRLYGIEDSGTDVLGGERGPQPTPPEFRYRTMWRHQQDLSDILDGLYFQGQIAAISDKNFLEEYYNNEWNFGPNNESFAYLTWQQNQFWASGLVMPKLDRPWIAQTAWLPRVDGAVVGQTFLDDRIVYSNRGSLAYAQDRPAQSYPYAIQSTDQRLNTGRADIYQEASVPFAAGPFKLAPYAMLDLAGYTQDLAGNAIGRVYGGGGLRGSIPFSHLYEDVTSEMFNLDGLYHKAVFGVNWMYARSNVQYNQLPMLDRLNDDAVDQAWREIKPYEPSYVPGPAGVALLGSPIYDPQLYAIRRGLTTNPDTLGDIDVVQMDLRQRLQTQRGYPGQEHTVDVAILDVSASYFPQESENFGKPFAFLEYNGQWNVGDRFSLVSAGWFDPYTDGTRYWNVGAYFDRNDRTNFYLGYRQTDPLNSKAVTASVGYQLSKRYYLNLASSYDFGIQAALSESLTVTRTGSDLTVSFGVTYNALVNNFGVQFLIIPNLAAALAPGRFAATQLANR